MALCTAKRRHKGVLRRSGDCSCIKLIEARMSEKKQNLQDVFLNHVRKEKIAVTIFLVNGVKLQGVVTWFDNFCLLLRRDSQSQLVYKHAISTVMPAQPIALWDQEPDED